MIEWEDLKRLLWRVLDIRKLCVLAAFHGSYLNPRVVVLMRSDVFEIASIHGYLIPYIAPVLIH